MNKLRDHLTAKLLAGPSAPNACACLTCETFRLAAILDMLEGWPPHARAVFEELIDVGRVAKHLQNATDIAVAIEMVQDGCVRARA